MLRPCPICGNTDVGKKLYANNMALLGELDMSYIVELCPRCGAVFANQTPTDEDYRAYYSKYSKYDLKPTPLDSDTEKMHMSFASFLEKNVHLDAKIIDIGCGNGHLLSCLAKRGFHTLSGIEPAPHGSKIAKEIYNIETVRRGFLSDVINRLSLEQYDLFCFTAVLEHLISPFEALNDLLSQCLNGTYIAIEVPDLEAFDGKKGEPYGEFSLEHINYFSKKSIAMFFKRLGCTVVDTYKIQYAYNGSLLVLAQKMIKHAQIVIDDHKIISEYIANSEKKLNTVLMNIQFGSEPIAIYGAGSHTARLLPRLKKMGVSVEKIFDKNSNLQNTCLGEIPILSIEKYDIDESMLILISSFLYEKEIYNQIKTFSKPIIIYSEGY